MACAQWSRGFVPRDGELRGQGPRGARDSHGREQALREEAESHRGDRSKEALEPFCGREPERRGP